VLRFRGTAVDLDAPPQCRKRRLQIVDIKKLEKLQLPPRYSVNSVNSVTLRAVHGKSREEGSRLARLPLPRRAVAPRQARGDPHRHKALPDKAADRIPRSE
jgi:hypothetical protein